MNKYKLGENNQHKIELEMLTPQDGSMTISLLTVTLTHLMPIIQLGFKLFGKKKQKKKLEEVIQL